MVLEGEGTVVDYDHDPRIPFCSGSVVHVPVGVRHAVFADRGVGIVSVGGPATADVVLLKSVGALPADAAMPEAASGTRSA